MPGNMKMYKAGGKVKGDCGPMGKKKPMPMKKGGKVKKPC